MSEFETFVNLELPRRSALLTYEIVSYDGNPNDGSAPAILQGAPKGTWYLQQTGDVYWRKRTSAADSWVIANINATYEELDIYVRDVDGSDSNTGTNTEPIKTLIEAELRIPYHVDHTVKIHVGVHSGDGYEQPTFKERVLNANIYILGDGGGAIGEDGFTVYRAETTALAGSSIESVITSGLSTSEYGGMGELWGKTIRINSGAAAGDRRTIRNNTATEIFPDSPFSAAIADGDLYDITVPEVEIYQTSYNAPASIEKAGSMTSDAYLLSGAKYICFSNIRMSTATDIYYTFQVGIANVNLYGVIFSEEPRLYMSNSMIKGGFEFYEYLTADLSSPSLVTDLGIPNSKSWLGWGITCDDTATGQGTFHVNGSGNLQGFFNAEQIGILDRTKCRQYGGSMWGSDNWICASVSGPSAEYNIIPLTNDILIGTQSETLYAAGAGSSGKLRLYNYSDNKIILTSSSFSCVAYDRGILFMTLSVSTGIEINSDNIGIGSAEEGEVYIIGELPTVNATVGDFSEDYGNTVRDISELSSKGDVFMDMFHGIIRRASF